MGADEAIEPDLDEEVVMSVTAMVAAPPPPAAIPPVAPSPATEADPLYALSPLTMATLSISTESRYVSVDDSLNGSRVDLGVLLAGSGGRDGSSVVCDIDEQTFLGVTSGRVGSGRSPNGVVAW